MTIKAIETRYAGCHFRSRLEARWAVFFDHLGIRWEYEPQGFKVGLGPGIRYLPDFWLPDLNTWVEVKGADANLDRSLLSAAMDYGEGLPGMADTGSETGRGGLLLLGPVDAPRKWGLTWRVPTHTLLTHRKGVAHEPAVFLDDGSLVRADASRSCNLDDNSGFCPCPALLTTGLVAEHPMLEVIADKHTVRGVPPKVVTAYVTARSARFEHGQAG